MERSEESSVYNISSCQAAKTRKKQEYLLWTHTENSAASSSVGAAHHRCLQMRITIERNYHLYLDSQGAYEIVSVGWSFSALVLQLFWAIAYGVFRKYLLLFTPIVILGILAETELLNANYLKIVGITYLIGAFLIYFPYIAFKWHEKNLLAKGYVLQAMLKARSSNEALRKYAETQG